MASAGQPTSLLGTLLSLQESGKRLVDAGELYDAFKWIFGCDSGVAGGTAPPGTVMGAAVNEVTSGTNVALPPAIPGFQITVFNGTGGGLSVNASLSNPANSNTPDSIDGSGAAYQTTNQVALYTCYALGLWHQSQQGAIPTPP